MRIKFSKNELDLLKNTFLKDKSNLEFIIIEREAIDIVDDFVDEIRDWALEQQQIIGFDENYELTKEGKILENIIDKLYN